MREDTVCGGKIMRFGHLERFIINLKVLSPVFIGSGEQLTKKEYIFDPDSGLIHIPDLAMFYSFLSERSLLTAYEDYLMHPRYNNLLRFLTDNNIDENSYPSFVSYTIDAGELVDSKNLRGVLMFIKEKTGFPYIPGSSLKGALRSALAVKYLENGNYERNIRSIEQSADQYNYRRPNNYILRETEELENRIFRLLEINDPDRPGSIGWHNIVNDIMKGMHISDSMPIGYDRLTLCGKYDIKPDGTINRLPIYRECLMPGTEVKFTMTLDRTITDKAGIDIDCITDALIKYRQSQRDSFEKYFPELRNEMKDGNSRDDNVVLGGGAGYVGKTISYPLIHERSRALSLVGKMMTKQFPNHYHEDDIHQHMVSPHTFRAVKYKERYYQVGKCRIDFSG
jgi:CRISPR-associated protein Csm5